MADDTEPKPWRVRDKILAKHAPHVLRRERRKREAMRAQPSAGQVARAEKVAWIHALAAEVDGEGCRDWPWGLTDKGYGVVRWDGEHSKVGRVILALAGRPRPEGTIMLHSCDRRSCVAPWHLRWGTYAENSADAVERDRVDRRPGVENVNAKLTDAQVLAIRAMKGKRTCRALGEEYGVSFSVINKILLGKTWRHLLTTPEASR